MANISKHKLNFDPAESDDYDIVASFLKASDGTLITHTGGALDVNIDNASIAVTATDLDIRNLVFATDKVDASGSEVSLDAATLAALESITVSATDLDIRDLTFATDKVDASGSEVSLDAATLAALETITVLQGTSPWVVSATDLDIRNLSASQDNVAISDGTDTLAIQADGSINVNASEAGYSSCNYASVVIGTSATDIVVTELSGRKELTLQNVGAKDVYLGCNNSVTLANGILIPKGATASFRFGDAINVHAIADGASSELRIIELA